MYISISEWNKVNNTDCQNVAVWGDTPEYPEYIRAIVREITTQGYAEREDVTYYETEEER